MPHCRCRLAFDPAAAPARACGPAEYEKVRQYMIKRCRYAAALIMNVQIPEHGRDPGERWLAGKVRVGGVGEGWVEVGGEGPGAGNGPVSAG